MDNEKVFAMAFSKVYPCLVNKAVRKGRTQEEVDTLISWLTGYTAEDIHRAQIDGTTYGSFFRNAPAMNPLRRQIRGSICGIRLETIEDSTMQDIRYLDKLVDELAKGKTIDKILGKL